jgi:rhamnosyltransferase
MTSIIIPTLNASRLIPSLVARLRQQKEREIEIIVIDSESDDGSATVAAALGCHVYSIARRDFDHGGARNLAARNAVGEILVFLTQDVVPIGAEFLTHLTAPIKGRLAAAAYARQVAAADAPLTEAFARSYNYPEESSLRDIATIPRRTLRAFFFSNVASAVSRAAFESVGGFPAPVPTNEDMLLCARLLDGGYRIAYVAEARVTHSHSLTLPQVFRRYFRIGAVAREHQAILRSARNSGDGFDFVQRQINYLLKIGRYDLIPLAITEAGVKALAFYCGGASRSRIAATFPRAARSTTTG